MLYNQMNNGNSMMSNRTPSMPNMGNMIDSHRNLNNTSQHSGPMSSNFGSNKANIAGISKMPQMEDRFKNVKIDKDPAKQIMNSAGQNVIQNKIRGVRDISAN